MKKVLLFTLFLFTSFAGAQYVLPLERGEFTPLKADSFIGLDGFGNVFYTKGNVLYKKLGDTELQYQNLAYGPISRVDIINPLKVLIFYEQFNALVVVDSQLNEIQKIDFSKLPIPITAGAVGMCGQNKIWVFDVVSRQLGLYELTTGIYKSIGVPIQDSIVHYQTDFNYFTWKDSKGNWYSATIFGRVVNNGTIPNTETIQFLGTDAILYKEGDKLYFKEYKINRILEMGIVEKSFSNFYYKDQILSIFTDQGLTNYKITLR